MQKSLSIFAAQLYNIGKGEMEVGKKGYFMDIADYSSYQHVGASVQHKPSQSRCAGCLH
jgi:hypothetical protein